METDISLSHPIASQGPPLMNETTEALNAIVAALHAAAARADDVELDAVNDAHVARDGSVLITWEQAWMGHASIATTNLYLQHLGTSADKAGLDRLN